MSQTPNEKKNNNLPDQQWRALIDSLNKNFSLIDDKMAHAGRALVLLQEENKMLSSRIKTLEGILLPKNTSIH